MSNVESQMSKECRMLNVERVSRLQARGHRLQYRLVPKLQLGNQVGGRNWLRHSFDIWLSAFDILSIFFRHLTFDIRHSSALATVRRYPPASMARGAGGEHRVGFVVAGELLPIGSISRSAQADGDVAQVAEAGRAVADLDRRGRLLAALDAVEENADVRRVASTLYLPEELGATSSPVRCGPARDRRGFDHALGPLKPHAHRLLVGPANQFHAVCVTAEELGLQRRVEQASRGEPDGAAILDFDRAAVVHAQAPLGQVVRVGAVVGHLAAGVVVVEPESIEAAFLVVGDEGSGAQPHVIVESSGTGIGCQPGPGDLVVEAHVVVTRLTWPILPSRTSWQTCWLSRLLRSMLPVCKDPPVLADGLDQAPTWAMVSESGFLAIDVLAGLGGANRHDRVPLVGHDTVTASTSPVARTSRKSTCVRQAL